MHKNYMTFLIFFCYFQVCCTHTHTHTLICILENLGYFGLQCTDSMSLSVWETGVSRMRREGLKDKEKTLTRKILLQSVKICSLKVLWNIHTFSPCCNLVHTCTHKAISKYCFCSVSTSSDYFFYKTISLYTHKTLIQIVQKYHL